MMVRRVLESWAGTRYHADAPVRGVGAGCAGFVVAVLDEVFGVTDPRPFDTEWELRVGTVPLARAMARRYRSRVVDGVVVDPLDVIAFRQESGNLHLFIVGPDPGTVWHAGPAGVAMTGLGEVNTRRRPPVVYRPGLELVACKS